ncbi:hypothetical protein F4808DRAFT_398781 [Astrocystis sublimbata]|nr:hypothetical protein F4808DRAFT_398781 [Astrocystis sublimbata]
MPGYSYLEVPRRPAARTLVAVPGVVPGAGFGLPVFPVPCSLAAIYCRACLKTTPLETRPAHLKRGPFLRPNCSRPSPPSRNRNPLAFARAYAKRPVDCRHSSPQAIPRDLLGIIAGTNNRPLLHLVCVLTWPLPTRPTIQSALLRSLSEKITSTASLLTTPQPIVLQQHKIDRALTLVPSATRRVARENLCCHCPPAWLMVCSLPSALIVIPPVFDT